MLWYKRSCSLYKNTNLRKQFPKNSLEFFTCMGVLDFLNQLVGGEINVKETQNDLGEKITQLTIEEDLFFTLAKYDDMEIIGNYIKKANESGITNISLYEEKGLICIDIPEIEDELDNYTNTVNNKRRKLLPKGNIITIYATNNSGEDMKSVYKTINEDTGEEKYYLTGNVETDKEKYDEFLREYCD